MLYKYFKIITSIFTAVLLISTAFVDFNSYIAMADDLKKLESNTIVTFKSIQLQMQQSLEQQRLLLLTQRYYQLKDMLRKYPEDQDLKDEYLEVKEELKILKLKLNKDK